MKFKRIFLMVLDSLGVGETADAAEFGDTGCKGPDECQHLGARCERLSEVRCPSPLSSHVLSLRSVGCVLKAPELLSGKVGSTPQPALGL